MKSQKKEMVDKSERGVKEYKEEQGTPHKFE